MASDDQVVGFGFGDTGGDRADAPFGDQFDADARPGVDLLERKQSPADAGDVEPGTYLGEESWTVAIETVVTGTDVADSLNLWALLKNAIPDWATINANRADWLKEFATVVRS